MHDKVKNDDPMDLGEPAWEIATLFPSQGQWSHQEYLALDTNHLIEFTDGRVEVLPMPTELRGKPGKTMSRNSDRMRYIGLG